MADNHEIVRELRWQIANLHHSIDCLQDIIEQLTSSDEEEDEETVTVESETITKKEKTKVKRSTPSIPRVTPKQRRRSPNQGALHPHLRPTFLGVYDSEDQEIHAGDTVQFLSGGRFNTKTGVAYKVAGNLKRVTARDRKKQSISRAPENLKVIKSSPKRKP